jgi:hypothetical protein
MTTLLKIPLLFHALLEAAAALSFILNPAVQLPSATSDIETRLILRSYGGLLLSSSILCAGFYLRPGFDEATRLVSGAMAVYHLFPIGRSWTRLQMGRVKGGKVFGGPSVHLVVHLVALVGLGAAALWGEQSV